ncbi:hypothetical protein I5F10_12385 [Proteus mirabilis]|nr:hypothetical protein [Proteus mirabilis]MBG6048977.1 hypothetical protein [Proteus mirabilis]
MNEVSHLAIDKDIVTMLTAIIGAICLVIGGAIGFFTKYFYESKKLKENKKALRQQMITNNIAPMRQEWINDLRKSCADYFSDINLIIVYTNSKNDEFKLEMREEYKSRMFSLSKKFVYIDLLLPFKRDNNEEVEAEEFRDSLSEVNSFFNSTEEKPSLKDMKKHIADSREKLKKLLKKEWEETKSLREIDDKPNKKKKWYLLWIK